MLEGQLYAVEFFNGRGGETETCFFVARNDAELVNEFDNDIKAFNFLGKAVIFGFHDDEEDDEPAEAEKP